MIANLLGKPRYAMLISAISESRKQVKFRNSPGLPRLPASKKTVPGDAFIAVNITLPT
jgi:hypothetical protein